MTLVRSAFLYRVATWDAPHGDIRQRREGADSRGNHPACTWRNKDRSRIPRQPLRNSTLRAARSRRGRVWRHGRAHGAWQESAAVRSAGIRKIAHVPDPPGRMCRSARSEEHTSELQSLMRISYAVFCLKKKITTKNHKN